MRLLDQVDGDLAKRVPLDKRRVDPSRAEPAEDRVQVDLHVVGSPLGSLVRV